MKKLLITIIASFVVVSAVQAQQLWQYDSFTDRAQRAHEIGLVENPEDYVGDFETNIALLADYEGEIVVVEEPNFGGTNLLAGTTYNLAGGGISSSALSITLQKLDIPQTGKLITDDLLSDIFYITLEPGSRARQEIVSCTTITQNSGGDATLSGCLRGYLPFTPFTPSTTYQFSHGGGTQVIFSDPPQVFREFTAASNTESISGQWTFTIPPESVAPTTTLQLATKGYADAIANQGAATATQLVGGISELATAIETASSTDLGATQPLVLQAKNASSTPSTIGCDGTTFDGALCVVVSDNDGKLNQLWFDLTESFAWTGTHTWSGSGIFTGNFIVNNSSSTVSNLNISGNATTTNNLIVGTTSFGAPTNTLSVIGSSYFQGVVTTTATLDIKQLCIDGANCKVNFLGNYERVSANTSLNTSADTVTTGTVDCSSGNKILGGGHNQSGSGYRAQTSYPSDEDTWTATVICLSGISGTCSAGNITVYALCATP